MMKWAINFKIQNKIPSCLSWLNKATSDKDLIFQFYLPNYLNNLHIFDQRNDKMLNVWWHGEFDIFPMKNAAPRVELEPSKFV